MWVYEKQKKDYIIKNTTNGITFKLPYKQETNNYILYWNEKKVKKLINGLNDGTIPFDTDGLTYFRMNPPQSFSIKNIE